VARWIELTAAKQAEVFSQVAKKPSGGRPESAVNAAARSLVIEKRDAHRAELTKLERDEQVAEWIKITERVSRQVDAKPQGGRPEGGSPRTRRRSG
jgi:hypothetical protein